MSCDVGEATKGSLQHEISRIGTFILVINYFLYQNKFCGPGGSSGKALGYRLDGPGSIPGVGGGGDFSSPLLVQTGLGVHSTSYKMSTGKFLRG